MKNSKFITLSLLCILCLGACKEADYLTATNINSPDADFFVQDKTTAEATIFAIYSGLQFNGVTGGSAMNALEGMSVNIKAPHFSRNGGTGAANALSFTGDSSFPLGSFRDLYQLIDRANLSIKSISELNDGILASNEKYQYLGEAHFLRALAYFWLNTTFREIPLITSPASTIEEILANSDNIQPKSVIYEQIEKDLLFAQQFLPYIGEDRPLIVNGSALTLPNGDPAVISPYESKGRATWGAATAYLGKVYLYQNKNAQAEAEFAKIVKGKGMSQYRLVANYLHNSDIEHEWNDESIFEVGYAQSSPPVNTGNFGGGEGNSPNETTTRGYLFNWTRNGWGSSFPTNYLTELMKSDVADPDNPINYVDGDITNKNPDNFYGYTKRCNATVAFEEDGEQWYDLKLTRITADPDTTGDDLIWSESQSRIRKGTNWFLAGGEPIQAVSEINERLMRLADVYLMYAEAMLKTRGDAAAAEAVVYIDRVRVRSGALPLEKLFDYKVEPNTDNERTRYYYEDLQNTGNILNPTPIGPQSITSAADILKHLFYEERPMELALEGRGITLQDTQRREDLVEWINFVNDLEHRINGQTQEFAEAARKITADPDAILFSRPSVETIGSSN